ncbi:MAG: hypothetical protein KTR29_15440 [Rhodothermaceae bacterium]|nr:hypothetical protein [Rhodothermaceae bacterium]
MKKILLITCILITYGCDSNNDDSDNMVEGLIEQIAPVDSTLSIQEQTIRVTAASRIEDQEGALIAFDALQLGDFVSVEVEEDAMGALVATQINRDEVICDGLVGGDTYENLEVPEGATCMLQGATIRGNLVINAAAIVTASGIDVGGNIQAQEADSITVNGNSVVGGNIQLSQGAAVEIEETMIDGDLQLELNSGMVMAMRTVIGGNMQVVQNLGGVALNDNEIAENMQCVGNNPMPTGAGNNAGSKEGQCFDL